MKRCGRESTGRLYGRGTNPCVTCWKVPYIGPERGKLREVNPVSAINTDEEKSGKRRAEARGNSAPLPHMAHSPRILSGSSRVPGHWEAKSSAVPGRHTAGWANEPRGWTAWVEIVGYCYGISFISVSSMKCQKFSGAKPCVKKRKACCPRMNSLAKYLALQYIRRYIAEFNEIECCSSQYSKILSH